MITSNIVAGKKQTTLYNTVRSAHGPSCERISVILTYFQPVKVFVLFLHLFLLLDRGRMSYSTNELKWQQLSHNNIEILEQPTNKSCFLRFKHNHITSIPDGQHYTVKLIRLSVKIIILKFMKV